MLNHLEEIGHNFPQNESDKNTLRTQQTIF